GRRAGRGTACGHWLKRYRPKPLACRCALLLVGLAFFACKLQRSSLQLVAVLLLV
ncbi:unnamed protein product, partial [Amoebophrya sp. A25]